MNKLFKGAVAGAAGLALLLGGAGTFAVWNDAAIFGPTAAINSGRLQFGYGPVSGSWYLNGNAVDPSAVLIVPGDVLTYSMSGVPIIAEGTDLTAVLGVNWDDLIESDGGAADDELLTALGDPQFLVNGAATDTVEITGSTSSGVQQSIAVDVIFTFDSETAGLTAQGGTVNLNGFNLTLTQTLST